MTAWGSTGTGGMSGSVTINLGPGGMFFGQQQQPRVIMCGKCEKKPAAHKITGLGVVCLPCFRDLRFNSVFSVLFEECKPENRQTLYRSLARIYHPDVNNGDDLPMQHLNAAKERFCT